MLNLTPHTIIIIDALNAEHKSKSVVIPPSGTIAKIVISKSPGTPIDFIDPTGAPVQIPVTVEFPVGIMGIPTEDIQIEIEGFPQQQNEICIVSREVLIAAHIFNHPALPKLYAPGEQVSHKPGSHIIGCRGLITHLQDKAVKNPE